MQGRIVFATGNAGKIKEIRMIMEDTGMEVVSMKDAGIMADIDENGKTYEENALIKARAVAVLRMTSSWRMTPDWRLTI